MGHDRKLDIHDFVTPDRRGVIKALGASLGASVFLSELALPTRVLAQSALKADPFALGVASGDPALDGFVIWTRLAPKPLEVGGGMPSAAVPVKWSVASDEAMTKVVRGGVFLARPERAHAVHVEIGGLAPGREYFYRFEASGVRSPVGRSKTLPALGSTTPVRFAAAGCQRYEDGYFTAWRRIAEDNVDFVVHYGDYIYEMKGIPLEDQRPLRVVRAMPGLPPKCIKLEDYRNRYAIYKLDPDLQAAHASAPFLPSYDDHEVENNWADTRSEVKGTTREEMLLRRTAAFQAWYEHMPLRGAQQPRGPNIQAFRRFEVGGLVQVNMLDTRQYRSPQPCGDGWKSCPEMQEAQRTMLGKVQEAWLAQGFARRRTPWTLLAQQVPMGRFDRNPDLAVSEMHMDKWDGAEAARTRVFDMAQAAGARDLVVLAGDVHQNRVNELKRDFLEPSSATVGVEFVATSIASNGDGIDQPRNADDIRSANPHLKYFNTQRGYVRHTVSADKWQADYMIVDKISEKGAPATARAKFVVEKGQPGVAKA